MCGIAGAAWTDPNQAIDDVTLRAMCDAIAHRGPDDQRYWSDRQHHDAQGRSMGAALGFRRLAIIDLEGAAQPMGNEDGEIQMVFNGEIYNYRELRQRLQGTGHRFKTDGDGESILHLYEDVGTDVFKHLNGMFAVAIRDSRRNRMILGRDRIGQKPLFYCVRDGRLLFASEIKALRKVPGVGTEISPDAIDAFLTYQYIPYPETIHPDVRQLPPGHWAVFDAAGYRTQKYWDFDPSIERPIAKADAIERLRELLGDSVRLRMRSDVPLGTFLSGGVDSSLITALAGEHTDRPVQTYSIGFDAAEYDETHHAAAVAEHLGTDHTRFEVTADAVSVLQQLVHHYDQPYGDSSAVPTWYLSQLTRGGVKVALSGDGGDELFAGYDRHHALQWSETLRRRLPIHRLPGIGLIDRLPDSGRRRSVVRRAKRFVEAMGQPPVRRYMNWLQMFPESMRAEMYRDDFVPQLTGGDPVAFLERVWDRSEGRDLITRASMTDIQTYLPCDLMTKVDIASMAHGLEVRQPMLDYRLVEFAAALPVSLKFDGRRGKRLLRDAYEDRLPRGVFTRPKMGFGIPIAAWFRGPLDALVDDTVLAGDARIDEFLRPDYVRGLFDAHRGGTRNEGYRLWQLLVLETWLRQRSGN